MEVFNSDEYYLVWNGGTCLWCNKKTGQLEIKNNINPPKNSDLTCLGVVDGFLGLLKPMTDPKYASLLFVVEQSNIGTIYGDKNVIQIDRITFLPLTKDLFTNTQNDMADSNFATYDDEIFSNFRTCYKHEIKSEKSSQKDNPFQAIFPSTQTIKNLINSNPNTIFPFQKTWASLKNVAENLTPAMVLSEFTDYDETKLAKRIYIEIAKMFNYTRSFFYSRTIDLTSNAQRLMEKQSHLLYPSPAHKTSISDDKTIQLSDFSNPSLNSSSLQYDWRDCDERFFWNHNILNDLITLKVSQLELNGWILPIIQGYVNINFITYHDFISEEVDTSQQPSSESKNNKTDNKIFGLKNNGGLNISPTLASKLEKSSITFCVISRRNRHRTGTRYNRRGIDEEGNAANYVETEQLLCVSNHNLSFVMIRGSIPLYWSQGGMKYRPAPTLEKDESENFTAFKRHFDRELDNYDEVFAINLAEQNGRERFISEAFLEQILKYDCDKVTYISFDFHEYCQGMRFENISVLTESIAEIIKDMQYCWFDDKGFICKQKGVFRINCIDCLDRTNMVQTALAKIFLEIQLRKIGLLSPEAKMPPTLTRLFQLAWANNGDALSLQYAGTAALKGDFTRTGQKKLTSLFKDGYNSATRYYMNQFRDAYRQLAYQTLQNYAPLLSNTDNETLATRLRIDQIPVLKKLLLKNQTQPSNAPVPLIKNIINLPKPPNNLIDISDPEEIDDYFEHETEMEEGDPNLASEKVPKAYNNLSTSPNEEELLHECQKCVIPSDTIIYGSWLLKALTKQTDVKTNYDTHKIALFLTQSVFYIIGLPRLFRTEAFSSQILYRVKVSLESLLFITYAQNKPPKDSCLVIVYTIKDFTSKVSSNQSLVLFGSHHHHTQDPNPTPQKVCNGGPTMITQKLSLVYECFKAVCEMMNVKCRFNILVDREIDIASLTQNYPLFFGVKTSPDLRTSRSHSIPHHESISQQHDKKQAADDLTICSSSVKTTTKKSMTANTDWDISKLTSKNKNQNTTPSIYTSQTDLQLDVQNETKKSLTLTDKKYDMHKAKLKSKTRIMEL